MPRRCSIPGCKANYTSTLKTMGAVSTFQFPKNEELKKKWLEAIARKDWKPTSSSSVCRLHFREEDIIPPLDPMDYQRFRLKVDAVPSIFNSFPNVLSPSTAQIFKKKEKDDSIEDFSNLVNIYPRRIQMPDNWSSKLVDNALHFFILDFTKDEIDIRNQIAVFEDLQLSVIMDNIQIDISGLPCFNSEIKLRKWSQLQFLLGALSEQIKTKPFFK